MEITTEMCASQIVNGGWAVANATRRAITHVNLANRAQALCAAETLSAARPDNEYIVYEQSNGRLVIDSIIVGSKSVPLFESVEF